jgi:hypothetical protein
MANPNMDYKAHNSTYDKVFISGLVKAGTIGFVLMMGVVLFFTL